MAAFSDLTHFNWEKECDEFERAVCNNQGRLFEVCQTDYHCDALDFIQQFMQSRIAARMDKPISSCHNTGTKQLGDLFVGQTDIQPLTDEINSEVLFWTGYVYRYWAWMGTPSREIVQIAPAEKMFICYGGFHTLDVKEAIRLLIQRGRASAQ